jgi:uncharacterized membrane protein YczE
MLAWWPLRRRPGAGTVANVVIIGVTIDLLLPHTDPAHHLGLRVGLMALGVLLFALGSGMYLGVDMGAGPRDGLMTGLHDRFGWSIRWARTVIEVTVLVIGIGLGGTAGVGTLVFACGIGPLVQVALRWFGFGTRRVEELGRPLGLSGE